LEIGAAVTRRLQAEPLDFAGDVVGSFHVPDRARFTTLHRIVGKDVQPRHEVSGCDRRRRRLRRMLERELGRRLRHDGRM